MITNSTTRNTLITAIVNKSVAMGGRLVVDNALCVTTPIIISKSRAIIRDIKLPCISDDYSR